MKEYEIPVTTESAKDALGDSGRPLGGEAVENTIVTKKALAVIQEDTEGQPCLESEAMDSLREMITQLFDNKISLDDFSEVYPKGFDRMNASINSIVDFLEDENNNLPLDIQSLVKEFKGLLDFTQSLERLNLWVLDEYDSNFTGVEELAFSHYRDYEIFFKNLGIIIEKTGLSLHLENNDPFDLLKYLNNLYKRYNFSPKNVIEERFRLRGLGFTDYVTNFIEGLYKKSIEIEKYVDFFQLTTKLDNLLLGVLEDEYDGGIKPKRLDAISVSFVKEIKELQGEIDNFIKENEGCFVTEMDDFIHSETNRISTIIGIVQLFADNVEQESKNLVSVGTTKIIFDNFKIPRDLIFPKLPNLLN